MGNVIYESSFGDRQRAGWFVNGTHEFEFPGEAIRVIPGGGIARTMQKPFPRTSLAVGDSLLVSFRFQLAADLIPSLDRQLRFGLFDSGGSPIQADNTNNAVTDPHNRNYVGYWVGISTGRSEAPPPNEFVNFYNNLSQSNFMSILSGAGLNLDSEWTFGNLADSVERPMVLRIDRLGESEYRLSYLVGGVGDASRTHEMGGEFTDSFDTFVIYTNQPAAEGQPGAYTPEENLSYVLSHVVITSTGTTVASPYWDPPSEGVTRHYDEENAPIGSVIGLGGDWVHSDNFGVVYLGAKIPYIFSPANGWISAESKIADWLFLNVVETNDWLATRDAIGGWLYSFAAEDWISP